MKPIKMNNTYIGEGHLPYIIADIGANHNGDMNLCRKLIDSAVSCGVNVVKFQSFTTENLISLPLYEKHLTYPGDEHKHFGSLYEMVKEYSLTPKEYEEILSYCQKKHIAFASTPFDTKTADLLDKLDVPFFKIASMDVTNHPLLEYVATKGKPVILSTGMATLWEIDQAMEILRGGKIDTVLLHCISVYPPKYEDINLKNIEMLRKTFGVHVGFSDHSVGTSLSVAAVSFGACIIEKHFTLDKTLPGWDHSISADPVEMEYIVKEVKNVFHAVGQYERVVGTYEIEKRKEFRRSIVARTNLAKGQVLTEKDLAYKRPEEGGILPLKYKDLIGRKLVRSIKKDQQITSSHLL
ncbi:N-acetylneuraminate synthase family protein [Candidatus Gottesmanbacteria bacterium]|nr:N-acetylneuraminate synthase family protein [Candidatus Gottesmanbacteria bacterium]